MRHTDEALTEAPKRNQRAGDPMDRTRFPVDPWRLVETRQNASDLGVTETQFTTANGYLGMRGNPEEGEGRDAHIHGTFLNGFHETWEIRHPESAFGFARTGQTLVNVPDAKLLKLYVDDRPLNTASADLESYERSMDFRDGILRRDLVWRTPAGDRVRVRSTRMASMIDRHLALMTLEVTMLSGEAPVHVSSQVLNRQDVLDEYHASHRSTPRDPRKSDGFTDRVLQPRLQQQEDGRVLLGYQCTSSQMTLAVGADHVVESDDGASVTVEPEVSEDVAKTLIKTDASEGQTLRVTKTVAYHTSDSVPVSELADRCHRTLDRVADRGVERVVQNQQAWFREYWEESDVVVEGAGQEQQATQQAIRFNLFQLAQAAARADQQGIPAKGMTGSGYEGHYFWDTEVYVTPFLTYTHPDLARNTLHFRSRMLPKARERARELSMEGALYPWRTINGEEASAYYAAGTAQVHIDADVVYALSQYLAATGDTGFLARDGIDMLVETARMYADLGFWRENGAPEFHVHGVTGPDEYNTVVNNNLFTNVMARFNLERAADAIEELRTEDVGAYARVVQRLGVSDEEVAFWRAAAAGMRVPYDAGLGIHPQDDHFLDKEKWDLSRTPDEQRPLMLNFHPLVIYRYQVLKQADVVLALFLQGDRFTTEEKRKDFEYYDPITTGDSTLSAVVQSVIAAEVGYHEAALAYFLAALYVDLSDDHGNTVDGIHVASCGGVWTSLVYGFAGMRDHHGELMFDPRLPQDWSRVSFHLRWHGSRLRVEVTQDAITLTVVEGETAVPVHVRGAAHTVTKGEPVRVPLTDQGPRMPGMLSERPRTGQLRPDGSKITADVPLTSGELSGEGHEPA